MFGDWEMDVGAAALRHRHTLVHVEPQVFDVLAHLIIHRDRVVGKDELLDEVWGGHFVTDSALTSRIKVIRRTLGDDGRRQQVVRTVRGRGYQFVAAVEPVVAASAIPDSHSDVDRSDVVQRIETTVASDGVRIAYATAGQGPPLLKAANWMSHLAHDWANPVWRHWLTALTCRNTLIRYDARGCGLSDPVVSDFDSWVDDLELVADVAGLDRFPLFGMSQGAAVAVAYAVRHPERVSRLILVGGYARGRMARATSEAQRREATLDIELARVGWDNDDPSFRQVFTAQFLPSGSREQWTAFDDLQRRTTSAPNAVAFLDAFSRIDITHIAGQVSCPTLVVHSRDDRRVPFTQAEELARLIPRSTLLALDSANHLLTADERAWAAFLVEGGAFLAQA